MARGRQTERTSVAFVLVEHSSRGKKAERKGGRKREKKKEERKEEPPARRCSFVHTFLPSGHFSVQQTSESTLPLLATRNLPHSRLLPVPPAMKLELRLLPAHFGDSFECSLQVRRLCRGTSDIGQKEKFHFPNRGMDLNVPAFYFVSLTFFRFFHATLLRFRSQASL